MILSKRLSLPRFSDGDDMLPALPTPEAIEDWMFSGLAILQKYGVLLTLILSLMFLIFNRLAKAKKNPQVARFWSLLAWGMIFLTILFSILPYMILHFY
ncbi:hypothetical protein [Paenibacillus thiaminolyticus]|uniref:Uncharacterized protein n=1 Tax=Paenibacillus thiaminolyticus TaxID=49283 RepID=A0A3A3GYS8_PANTH|nr:hypothetical protein [Paenibacillus thiaminolyticus]RJG21377.1 hypothetical protein DQX05_22015 [Paenibacillus thiaminolyticus]